MYCHGAHAYVGKEVCTVASTSADSQNFRRFREMPTSPGRYLSLSLLLNDTYHVKLVSI